MDIERTMQFILESQAKAEIRMAKAEDRQDKAEVRAEARHARNEARIAAMEKRLDRRMNAITKLLQQGMALIASLRNGRNGR